MTERIDIRCGWLTLRVSWALFTTSAPIGWWVARIVESDGQYYWRLSSKYTYFPSNGHRSLDSLEEAKKVVEKAIENDRDYKYIIEGEISNLPKRVFE